MFWTLINPPDSEEDEEVKVCKKHGKHRHGHHHGHGHGHHHGLELETDEWLLSECTTGELVSVKRILNGGPIRHRLLEMGLNPGTEVRVVKYAPMKDPIECVLKGYHIALRVAEARHVIVTSMKQ